MLAASQYQGDLAQFDLDLGGSTRLRRRLLDAWQSFAKAPQWRAARWAAGIALLAQLLGLNAWAFKENRAIAQRHQATVSLLDAPGGGLLVRVTFLREGGREKGEATVFQVKRNLIARGYCF